MSVYVNDIISYNTLTRCQAFHRAESESHLAIQRVRKSQESYTSDGDGDSGVGPDSTGSRWVYAYNLAN